MNGNFPIVGFRYEARILQKRYVKVENSTERE